MARPVVVDTDVLVDFLRGHPKAVTAIRDHANRIVLPSIVVAELYAGVKGEHEETTLADLVSLFRVVSVDAQLARLGGLLRRDFGRSHGVGLADAIVAATARAENASLMTLNVEHYPMLRGLRPAYVKR